MNHKAQLRQDGLRARTALGADARRRKSAAMRGFLADWDVFRRARHICLYASFGTEAETLPLLDSFYAGVTSPRCLYLPRVQGGALVLHCVAPPASEKKRCVGGASPAAEGASAVCASLVRSPMGMPEPCAEAPLAAPQQIDLILVPGSAFSESGDRLGYGKGFYDRLLAAAPQAVKIGFCFEAQVFPAAGFPVQPHDIPLDFLLTEKGIRQVHRGQTGGLPI